MITYAKALRLIEKISINLKNEKISSINSINRVPAENILSPNNNPLSNNTAFDGFAILAKETKGLSKKKHRVVFPSPDGDLFNHDIAKKMSEQNELTFICGHYKGIDQRVRDNLVTDEISIGDFVLAGGELAALTIIETVARLKPGVLGNESSAKEESFSEGLLEYPQFTRPSSFRDLEVPEILLSGDHAKIERWRKAASIAKTLSLRPDLIEIRGGLSEDENKLLEEFGF